MTDKAYYFAYGTNLSEFNMVENYPTARFYRFAKITGFKLWFTSTSGKSGSGVASILPGSSHDYVEGVVYEVDQSEIKDPFDGSAMSLMAVDTDDGRWGRAYVYFCYNNKLVTPAVEYVSYMHKKYSDYGFNLAHLAAPFKEANDVQDT